MSYNLSTQSASLQEFSNEEDAVNNDLQEGDFYKLPEDPVIKVKLVAVVGQIQNRILIYPDSDGVNPVEFTMNPGQRGSIDWGDGSPLELFDIIGYPQGFSKVVPNSTSRIVIKAYYFDTLPSVEVTSNNIYSIYIPKSFKVSNYNISIIASTSVIQTVESLLETFVTKNYGINLTINLPLSPLYGEAANYKQILISQGSTIITA